MIQADGTKDTQAPNIASRTLNSVKCNSLLPEAPLSGDGGGSCALGFRAQGPDRFLKLAWWQVEVGLNFGGEVSVVLEPKALRNHLERETFRDQAAGQEHPVTPEKFFRAQSGGSLDGVFQLPVGEGESLGHPRDGEVFSLGEFEQILSVRAHEPLPFAGNLELWGVSRHQAIQN